MLDADDVEDVQPAEAVTTASSKHMDIFLSSSIVIVLLINPHMQAYFLVKVGLSRVRINPHMQGHNMTKLRHICQGSLISRPYQFSSVMVVLAQCFCLYFYFYQNCYHFAHSIFCYLCFLNVNIYKQFSD